MTSRREHLPKRRSSNWTTGSDLDNTEESIAPTSDLETSVPELHECSLDSESFLEMLTQRPESPEPKKRKAQDEPPAKRIKTAPSLSIDAAVDHAENPLHQADKASRTEAPRPLKPPRRRPREKREDQLDKHWHNSGTVYCIDVPTTRSAAPKTPASQSAWMDSLRNHVQKNQARIRRIVDSSESFDIQSWDDLASRPRRDYMTQEAAEVLSIFDTCRKPELINWRKQGHSTVTVIKNPVQSFVCLSRSSLLDTRRGREKLRQSLFCRNSQSTNKFNPGSILILDTIKDDIKIIDGIFRTGANVPEFIGVHGGSELCRPAPLEVQDILWLSKHHFPPNSTIIDAPQSSGRDTPISPEELSILRDVSDKSEAAFRLSTDRRSAALWSAYETSPNTDDRYESLFTRVGSDATKGLASATHFPRTTFLLDSNNIVHAFGGISPNTPTFP